MKGITRMARSRRMTRRLMFVLGGLALLGVAVALVLTALRSNIVYFFSPAELAGKALEPRQRIRLGGLVEEGSVSRPEGDLVLFRVTDGKADLPVRYNGLLPDLFREGQGVVAEGRLGADGVFVADTILAKHDEKYMPREVADALKKSGEWRPSP